MLAVRAGAPRPGSEQTPARNRTLRCYAQRRHAEAVTLSQAERKKRFEALAREVGAKQSPVFENGHLVVPDRPGWGTEPNEGAIRARPPKGKGGLLNYGDKK